MMTKAADDSPYTTSDAFLALYRKTLPEIETPQRGGSSLLPIRFFDLRLVFVAYGKLAWSSLLTLEIRFVFLLTVPSVQKFGLVLLLMVP